MADSLTHDTNGFQQYYGLTIFFIINAINFADRLSITTVLTDIREYYGVDVGPASWLAPAFLFGYMFTAPIFGYLGDRYSRKFILIGGIAFWCLACAAGALMGPGHFNLFLFSRSLVGVGEASYSTIAPTLIADLFRPEKRKLALSIFYLAIPIGSGLGYVLGRVAKEEFGSWQTIFKMTPSIGFITILLLLPFKEPPRGKTEALNTATNQVDKSTVLENIIYLTRIRSYVWSTIGFTCCIFTMGALSWHAISFMEEAHGKDYNGTASVIFGLVIVVGGIVGVSLGSSIAQYYRDIDGRADAFVCAFGILAGVPLTFLGLVLARSALTLSWIFLLLSVIALSTNWAVISDMALTVTLPNKRAFASACQILFSHLFGDAISPIVVGYLREFFEATVTQDKFDAFMYALMPTLLLLALGVPAFLQSARFYVQDAETCASIMNKDRIEIDETMRSEDANLTDFAAVP